MKNHSKQVLSVIMSLIIIMSMFAGLDISSFAEDDIFKYPTHEIENEDVTISDWDEPVSGDVVLPVATIQETSEPTIFKGDVDLDRKITVSDSRLALEAVVGREELSHEQFQSADVDNDGTITSNDARIIVRIAAKLNDDYTNDYETVPSTPEISLSYRDSEENEGEVIVDVYAENVIYTCSGDVRFTFDSSVLEFRSLKIDNYANIAMAFSNSVGNEILFSFLSLYSISTDTKLCTITFNRLTSDASDITFESINWFGTYEPEAASVTVGQGSEYNPALRYFEYYISDDEVTITGCDDAISGDVVIPGTIQGYPVTSINYNAFYNCSNITSITIPASINSMSYGPFEYCSGLERIIVDENNEYYSSDESGVLFNKDKTTLFQYPAANSNTEYSIPESTTKIADDAFINCSNLEILRIHENVSSIGYMALNGCAGLTDIYFGGSIAGWEKLSSSAGIPESVTVHIAKDAELIEFFDYYISDDQVTLVTCYPTISGDITIPENIEGYPVTRLSNGLFSGCAALTGVTIPASVTMIEENVFYNCSSLTYISVDENNEYYTTDADGVLFNKNKTEIIRYPAAKTQSSYTIPDSVITIGFMSFTGSSNLESITIGNNTKRIASEAFNLCNALKNITIPESVTIIEDSAFEYCPSLSSVTLPGFVSYIGCYAMGFKYVNETNGSYYAPDENFVIYGIPDSASERFAKEYGINFESIAGESANPPSGEKYLVVSDTCGTNLTWSLYSDGEFIIKGSGDDFKGHRPTLDPTWWYFRKDIITVKIEHDITGIYSCSFRECSNLKSIYIPSTIEYISDDAFWDCNNIDTVYYEGSEAEWNEIIGKDSIRYIEIVFNYVDPEGPPVEKPTDVSNLDVKGEGGIVTDFENKISQIGKEVTIETLSSMIENKNFAIVDKNGKALTAKALVGTGSKIQILDSDGKVLNEYTILVPTDIDGNGKTTAADARLALRASAQLDTLEGVYATAADAVDDDKITASDARKILRISAGMEE